MKVLVVYYSRTGHTRRLAERLARELRGSAMPITEPRSRLGFLGYQRSLFEAVAGRDATIDPPRRDPRDYDLVLIGTPVWGWSLSSPVRAFARQWGRKLKQVGFFCTMGSGGDRGAFDELRRLIGHAPLAELALTDRELPLLNKGETRNRVDRFLHRLQPQHEAVMRQAA